jgi:hypothetical protein
MRQVLLLLSILFACPTVLATPITDTITAGEREWAQVDVFSGISWEDVDAACPAGVCSGTLGHNGVDYDMDGWEWASVDSVSSLFNYYLGGPFMSGPSSAEGDGITESFFDAGWRATVDNGGSPAVQTSPSWIGLFGWTSTIVPGTGIYLGGALDLEFNFSGVEDFYTTDAIDEFSNFFLGQSYGAGAWFSREATVDLPPTFTMMLIAMLVLQMTQRSGYIRNHG